MEANILHQNIGDKEQTLFLSIKQLIDQSRQSLAVSINTALCRLNYTIGQNIVQVIGFRPYENYGKSILATLSQKLTKEYGRGYTYSALTRMVKVANAFNPEMLGEENIKVAQYLTELPEKKWFADKLQRAIAIAKEHKDNNGI